MSNILISGAPNESFGGTVQFQYAPGNGDITIEAAHEGMPLAPLKTITSAEGADPDFEAFEDVRLGPGTYVVTLTGNATCSAW